MKNVTSLFCVLCFYGCLNSDGAMYTCIYIVVYFNEGFLILDLHDMIVKIANMVWRCLLKML